MNSPVIKRFHKSDIGERDGWNCYLCGIVLTYETATVDHVVPLSRGGHHTRKNAKLACAGCNRAKGDRNLKDFQALQGS